MEHRNHSRSRAVRLWIVGMAGVAVGLGLGMTGRGATAAPRCVGMFVATESQTLPVSAAWFDVVGEPPCTPVIGWATQGVHRVFDDGTIEVMATPVPPCEGREIVVWLRYRGD